MDKWRIISNKHTTSFWNDKNILDLDSDAWKHYKYPTNHRIVHLKEMNLMMSRLYLNLKKSSPMLGYCMQGPGFPQPIKMCVLSIYQLALAS